MQKNKYIIHCLNSSPSKQSHAFGKAQRFEIRKSYGEFKYNPSIPENKILTTFGMGQRQYERNGSRTPSPDKYRIKSEFDDKNKGYSFGRSPSKLNNQKQKSKSFLRDVSPLRKTYTRGYTEQNDDPEGVYQRLKNKLSTVNKQIYERYGNSEKRLTPNKNLPGPGAYNRFSQFGPVNYYR